MDSLDNFIKDIKKENKKISVFIKINEKGNITDINSDIFLRETSGWIKIDEGFGDRYAHAQNQYLNNALINELGNYNYKYTDGIIIEI